jgi:hypothetical protein
MRSITIDTRNVEAFALRKIGTYPEGSVSKREVVATVPCVGNAEELGWKLNGELTKAVYDYWRQANLDKPAHYQRSRDELTKLAQDTALALSSGKQAGKSS